MRSTEGFSVCNLYPSARKSKLYWSILLASAFVIAVIVALNVELSGDPMRIEQRKQQLRVAENDSLVEAKCHCPILRSIPAEPKFRPQLPPLPSTEFYVSVLNSRTRRRNDSFDPQITSTELEVMLHLLWTFLDMCEQHNVQVMLYGGTLLGSYRHHGIMPWDDDVDLLLKELDQGNLETLLGNGSAGMELTKAGRWKVWNKTACLYQEYSWCWPYLDLSFYRVHGDLLFDTVTAYGWNYSYPTRLTFPLHKRPFMGRWVDSPKDALRFLGYDKTPSDQCISLYYSHKREGKPESPVQSARCASLSVTYPFVVRVPEAAAAGATGVLEVLRFHGGWPVYTVPVAEPPGAFNFEFSFVPIQ